MDLEAFGVCRRLCVKVIRCPVCDRLFSDYASRCPDCQRLSPRGRLKLTLMIGSLVLVLVSLALALFLVEKYK